MRAPVTQELRQPTFTQLTEWNHSFPFLGVQPKSITVILDHGPRLPDSNQIVVVPSPLETKYLPNSTSRLDLEPQDLFNKSDVLLPTLGPEIRPKFLPVLLIGKLGLFRTLREGYSRDGVLDQPSTGRLNTVGEEPRDMSEISTDGIPRPILLPTFLNEGLKDLMGPIMVLELIEVGHSLILEEGLEDPKRSLV